MNDWHGLEPAVVINLPERWPWDMKKIVVPEGMLKAAYSAQLPCDSPSFSWEESDELTQRFYVRILEAALRWLSDNPIEPTLEEVQYMYDGHKGAHDETLQYIVVRWQQKMFRQSPAVAEAEVPVVGKFEIVPAIRKRAYDELLALARGEQIESGIGLDAIEVSALLSIAKGSPQKTEISNMLGDLLADRSTDQNLTADQHNAHVIEAYSRGKKAVI